MNTPTKITADGVVGISGKPVRIYHISLASTDTASVLSVCSGTAAGTELISLTGTANLNKELDFPEGLLFPDGCYLDVDANISYATIWWEVVSTS